MACEEFGDRVRVSVTSMMTRDNLAELLVRPPPLLCRLRASGVPVGMSPIGNHCGYLTAYDDLKALPELQSSRRKRYCHDLFEAFYVAVNGDVLGCCSDWGRAWVLGNLREHTLAGIWDGAVARERRLAMLEPPYDRLLPCRACSQARNIAANLSACAEARRRVTVAELVHDPLSARDWRAVVAAAPLWFTVTGNSMAPTFRVGDRVLIEPLRQGEPQPGAVTAFVRDGVLVVHRHLADGRFRGDASLHEDNGVSSDAVIGLVRRGRRAKDGREIVLRPRMSLRTYLWRVRLPVRAAAGRALRTFGLRRSRASLRSRCGEVFRRAWPELEHWPVRFLLANGGREALGILCRRFETCEHRVMGPILKRGLAAQTAWRLRRRGLEQTPLGRALEAVLPRELGVVARRRLVLQEIEHRAAAVLRTALIMKGAANSLLHYPAQTLRTSGDVDVLLPGTVVEQVFPETLADPGRGAESGFEPHHAEPFTLHGMKVEAHYHAGHLPQWGWSRCPGSPT
jgi:hypothetical protein